MATLFDCFERHLTNLEIESETHEAFITCVVEKYLINLGDLGFSFSSHAADTFNELCHEVTEMLQKKIYGHMSVNSYREFLRERASA